MSEIPEELAKEQTTTKSTKIYNYLKQQFPKSSSLKPTPQEIKDIAKTHDVSKALVYKMLRKLESEGAFGEPSLQPPSAKAKPPIITIKPEEPMVIEEEIAEIPQELIEQPPSEGEEIPTGIRPEAVLEGFKPKDVTYMFNLGFHKIAQFSHFEAWELETEESTRLGEIWSPILNKYLPQIIPYTPEIVAVIVTSEIILPRIWLWREHKKEQERDEEEKRKEAQKEKEKPQEPQEPQPSEPKTEPSAQELEEKKRSQKPQFLKKLG